VVDLFVNTDQYNIVQADLRLLMLIKTSQQAGIYSTLTR